jgi:hypothetical protein
MALGLSCTGFIIVWFPLEGFKKSNIFYRVWTINEGRPFFICYYLISLHQSDIVYIYIYIYIFDLYTKISYLTLSFILTDKYK